MIFAVQTDHIPTDQMAASLGPRCLQMLFMLNISFSAKCVNLGQSAVINNIDDSSTYEETLWFFYGIFVLLNM